MDKVDGLDLGTRARRCSVHGPNYKQLSFLDWVILDHANGRTTLAELLSLLPTGFDELKEAYHSMQQRGFITWAAPGASNLGQAKLSEELLGTSASAKLSNTTSLKANPSMVEEPELNLEGSVGLSFDPDLLKAVEQNLPPRLHASFRRFVPKLFDKSLDIEPEMQLYVEFLASRLEQLSAHDILGLAPQVKDRDAVKQAYLKRTKLFHPDRYFRKNIGPFETNIATLFKTLARAFAALSAQ